MRDGVETGMLAVWYGFTRAGVIKRLRKAGLEPIGTGRDGGALWPRKAALEVMSDTPKRGSSTNHSDVVYDFAQENSAQNQIPPRWQQPAGGVTDSGEESM